MKRLTFLLAFLLGSLSALPALAQDAKLKALQSAVQANPNVSDNHFNLGLEYFNRGQYEVALPEFERASKLNSKDLQAKEMYEFTKAFLAYNQGNFSEAAKGFSDTLRDNPKNVNAAQLLGVTYIKMKDFGKAEKALGDYISQFPQKDAQVNGNLNLAKIFVEQKRFPEALTALQKVLALDPKNFEALNNLGVANFQTGDFGKAAEAWKKSTASMKKDADPQEKARVYKYLGFSFYRSGALQAAIESYGQSLQYNPNDADVLYNLGVADLDNNSFDDAASSFAKAFAKNPSDSNAALGQAQAIDAAINSHLEKGSSFLVNSEYSRAISEWKRVLDYQPDHAEAKAFIADAEKKLSVEVGRLYESGRSAARAGNTQQALGQWNSALAMDPNSKDVNEAIKRLKLTSKVKVSSLVGQGDDYLASGDYSRAIEKYQQALRTTPQSASVKLKLHKTQTTQKSEFEKALSSGDRSEKAGKLRDAVQAFSRAVFVDPGNGEAKQRLDGARVHRSVKIEELLKDGQALFEGGNQKGSQEKFNDVLALDPNNEKANDYIKKMTGQQSQAKADAEQVKKIYYEGVNLYINGKIEEAITKWQECLKMDPSNINATSNINKAKAKLQSIQKLQRG